MPTDSSFSLKSSREKRSHFAEVSDIEKQLWACIHSKGVLDDDVKDLYHKACCIYEKLFLCNMELVDLQSVEYLLWRLHYKHIDEFRRRISQNSTNQMNIVDAHMEGFKVFLSEGTKFYQDLIRKIKRYYGLVDEPWFYKNHLVSDHTEQLKLRKCQFVCHRLYICLGDLVRYLELYEKPNNQQRNWSMAASYYLEAAKIYPDSGNPQNQLAVLATYIGDEFLALYHCIRSLAVKEPFPDALQNLVLLFERNKSSTISSLSNEVYDFCKPSEWISSPSKASIDIGLNNKTTLKASDHNHSTPTDLWSLIIRLTSFFFLESSLDNFFSTFTSTLRELEVLLALNVAKLSSTLESYQNMNLSKAAPYRALHIISVLLFIIHNLTEDQEQKILKPINGKQQSILVNLALTVTFMFMGRLVDRCLRGSPVIYFPLLPALLVFVEWLVGSLDKVNVDDEKCEKARCYFFGSFVELLNQLQENRAQDTITDHIALWEDYELRGFVPLSHTHASLDFSSHWEKEINYKMKSDYRAHRIVQAAIKISKRSRESNRKWIFYAEVEKKFSKMESGKSTIVEEEEDIVFKPIARYNSEPIPMEVSDECLQRASSLLVAQNRALIDSFTSRPPIPSASSSKQLGQDGPRFKGSKSSEGPIAAGPPSLSSWVVNTDKFSERGSVLKPIEEMTSFDVTKDESSVSRPIHLGLERSEAVTSGTTFSSPTPSAPLLPENAVWFKPPHSNIDRAGLSVPSFTGSNPWARPDIQWSHNHAMQDQYKAPIYGYQASRFELLDGWSYNNHPPLLPPSSSLLRGLYDKRRAEPQPLLEYLKQREWQLHQTPQFTGFPYTQK